MASTISTTNIDTAYPIAGQDNDSQGFRDNFTNIDTSFEAAKTEIEDLQSKVVLKSALLGDTLDNDFAGVVIQSAEVQDMRGTVLDTGAVAGAVAITITNAPFQKIAPTADITLSFAGFTAAGTHSAVQLQIAVVDVADTVTLPAAVTIGTDAIDGIAGQVITFIATGTYIFEFASSNNGASISITDVAPHGLKPTPSYGTAGAVTLDASIGTYFYPTSAATGAITFTFSNPVATGNVSSFTLEMLNAGGFAPVWPASVKWPGAEPTWTAGIDVVRFVTRDAGTSWLGILGGLAFA